MSSHIPTFRKAAAAATAARKAHKENGKLKGEQKKKVKNVVPAPVFFFF